MSSPRRLFGTDGIRGAFGAPPLDEATVRQVAKAVVQVLHEAGSSSPRLLIGGDTRESTPTLSSWLGETFAALGCACLDLGTVPTPGVAHLVVREGASAGVVVSASHNPFADNGIKLVGSDGFKFSDAQERRIEELCATGDRLEVAPGPGSFEPADERLRRAYVDHLIESVPHPLDGLRIVLDAGHGAASTFAGTPFEALGAQVKVTHAAPDGRNINRDCGSTAPDLVAQEVRDSDADLGFAFDGDADRVIMVDADGRVRDGDEILFLWATELQSSGRLRAPAIVATSMSNLGLERALAPSGDRRRALRRR